MMKREKENEMTTLLEHISELNAASEAKLAANPNLLIGMLPVDVDFWVERGVIDVESYTRWDLSNTIYDMHKDAYGVRGRHYNFDAMSIEDMEIEIEALDKQITVKINEERDAENAAIKKFESSIKKIIECGAADRETAIRWMTEGYVFYHIQDVESFVYELGFLFTEYGKKLIREIERVIEYKERDW